MAEKDDGYIRFRCRMCGKRLKVKDTIEGGNVMPCPRCGAAVTVPMGNLEAIAEGTAMPETGQPGRLNVDPELVRKRLAGEDEPTEEGTSEDGLPWFQFNIATLLAAQTIASVVLAAWKSLQGRGSFVLGFFVAYLLFLAIPPLLIAAGTIGVATDLNRARQVWRYVGRALTVGAGLVFLFFLLARMAVALGVSF